MLTCQAVVGTYLYGALGLGMGIVLYCITSQGLKALFSRDIRAATTLCKQSQFEEAIPAYLRSSKFFDQHPWIDRWRAVTMLSYSGMSYREMSLLGLAFAYGQIGDGELMRESYETCTRLFPSSGMASAALRMIDAAKSDNIGARP